MIFLFYWPQKLKRQRPYLRSAIVIIIIIFLIIIVIIVIIIIIKGCGAIFLFFLTLIQQSADDILFDLLHDFCPLCNFITQHCVDLVLTLCFFCSKMFRLFPSMFDFCSIYMTKLNLKVVPCIHLEIWNSNPSKSISIQSLSFKLYSICPQNLMVISKYKSTIPGKVFSSQFIHKVVRTQ